MTKAHTQRAHAKLSPSSAYRWFECPGSIRLSADIEQKSSRFADEGTAAHELAAFCLKHEQDPADYLGGSVNIQAGVVSRAEAPEGFDYVYPIDEEMVEGVGLYVETIRALILPDDEFEIECKLDLRHIEGMEFGTGDFLLYRPSTKAMWICDFKYGKGVPVEVDENEQLLVYAEGTAKRFHNRGLDKVTMMVVQPRCPHPKGPVRLATIDALDLAEFRFKLEEAAERTAEASESLTTQAGSGTPLKEWVDANLHPGEHCRFCPAAATCPALQKHSLETAELEFADEPPKVADLPAERVAEVLAKARVLGDWIKRVEERAHAMAMEGTPPPGYKLVCSTTHRRFKDEVSADYLADMFDGDPADFMTEPKLKSPAQVVKAIGKKREAELAGLVYKPRGKTILVPDSDPREPVKPEATEEFSA